MQIPRSPVRIRLARFGRKHSPQYNIVVAKRGKARDSLPLEVVGTYNPIPIPLAPSQAGTSGVRSYKDIHIDFDRSKYWIGVGADVSERVAYLFKKAGLLPEEWPKPEKLTQHRKAPVVVQSQTIYEEPVELYRKR